MKEALLVGIRATTIRHTHLKSWSGILNILSTNSWFTPYNGKKLFRNRWRSFQNNHFSRLSDTSGRKRVKIDARNELLAGLDRQTRQNTRIGDRQVVIQQFQGFRSFDGYGSVNTSRLIRENANRVLDIGLLDRAGGVQ